MWGETGALDFHGREVWEKWNSMKVWSCMFQRKGLGWRS